MRRIRTIGKSIGAATALLAAVAMATPAEAQVLRPYEVRKRVDQYGGVTLASNSIVTCTTSVQCTAARANALGTSQNNDFNASYIDADADVTTFSSSRSALVLPATADVTWAGLYWGARSNAAAAVDRQVKLQVPGALSYEPLVADVFDELNAGNDYQGFVDVTGQVRAAGVGDYWVGDVTASTGGANQFGGWSLVVIYRDSDPAASLRSVSVFDGASTYSNGPQVFTLDNFLTPLAGPVVTELGVIQYDGDRGQGDTMVMVGGPGVGQITTSVGNVVSPTTDVMNSTISRNGVNVPAANRTPAYANTLGYDADFFTLNNRIPNGGRSATVTVQTGGENIPGGVFIFATDIYIPNLVGLKTSTDLNGGTLNPGDTIEYTIDVVNDGLDAAIDAVLTDAMPGGTTFVANSIVVNGAAEDDDPADAVGGFDDVGNQVIINMGQVPGTMEIDEVFQLVFQVTIDANPPAGLEIRNQALLSYAGETLGVGTTFDDDTDGDDVTDGDNPTSNDINDAPVAVDDAVAIDEDTAATFDPAGNDTDAEGDALVVTAVGTPSSGTLVLNADGTVTFTPDADFSGDVTFTYTVADAGGLEDTGTVTITVNPINDPPRLEDDSVSTGTDQAVVIDVLANDSDPEGALTVTSVSNPPNGSVVINGDGTVTYTPDAGYQGLDSFTYTATDSDGVSRTATVTVGVGDDTDGDGLVDFIEVAGGTDPTDADSDDDGVLDGDERKWDLDTDGDGLINALDPDSDNDGLLDGTESGVTSPSADTDVGAGNFVPDADPKTTTDPLDADTDDGSVSDGAEDTNLDGRVDAGETDPNVGADDLANVDTDGDGLPDAVEVLIGTDPDDADSDDDGIVDGDEPNWSLDSDGDGLINPLDPDSDNDGLFDGTETGVTTPSAATDVGAGHFIPDGDGGTTTTDPLDPDTDDGGIKDGAEDFDRDGVVDPGEGDPNDAADDDLLTDTDGDGLPDDLEIAIGTNPDDADSDDDGVIDGSEPNGADDTDGDGLINALDPDSDDDGLFDGTELGVTTPNDDTDVGAGNFVPDADPSTTTGPLNPDTDGGGVIDGDEDSNHDGQVDAGERDPNNVADDQELDRDGDGIVDGIDNCPDVANPDQLDTDRDSVGAVCDPDDDNDGFFDGSGVQGGGCQASVGTNGPGPGALFGLAILGIVMATRRRRRQVRVAIGAMGAATLALATTAHPVAAQAVEPRNFMVERLQLATDRQGLLSVEWAEAPGHQAFDLALWGGYENDPLVIYADDGSGREVVGELVASRVHASVTAAYSPTTWLQVGLEMPLILSQDRPSTSDVTPDGLAGLSGSGFGNVRIAPKLTLLRQSRHGLGLAVIPTLYLPTQSASDAYFGDRGVGFAPELVLSRSLGRLRLAANLGWKSRKRATVADLVVDDELTARVGLGLRLKTGPMPLDMNFALSLATAAKAPLDDFNTNHAEVLGGLAYQVAKPVQAFAGGGIGLANGYGTPDWRVLAGVRLTFGARADNDPDGDGIIGVADACPLVAEDRDGFEDRDGCIDPDNDDDGVLDVVDGAPMDPEDQDGVEDTDGVPDPDNDQDGVLDGDDACPVVAGIAAAKGCPAVDSDGDGLFDHADTCPQDAEDADQYEDADGCPDPDNDSDGTLDVNDRCPVEPGPAGNQGCPDPDGDGDGVVDRLDNCPTEPGTSANKGCGKKQLVTITDGTLDILESVYFKTNKAVIIAKSFKLLDNVAEVLASHAQLKIQVEGHTDSQGKDAANKVLSQRRADAVVAYLVKQGVAADRLTAVGFGEEVPVADNGSKAGRAQNRRVVFTIIGGHDQVKTSEQGAGADTIDQ